MEINKEYELINDYMTLFNERSINNETAGLISFFVIMGQAFKDQFTIPIGSLTLDIRVSCFWLQDTRSGKCVSEDTEILTDRGWLKYDQITKDDTIYSLNDNEELEKGEIYDIFIYPEEPRKMISIKSSTQDQLITLNHKIIYRNKQNKLFKRTLDKMPERFSILSGAKYEGTYDKLNDLEVRLLGWLMTDSYVKQNILEISQTEKKYYKDIIEILEELKIKYKELVRDTYTHNKVHRFFIHRRELPSEILKHINDNKILTNDLLNMSQHQLKILYDEMIKGDGSIYSSINKTFHCGSQEKANKFQELCVKLGYRAFITKVSKHIYYLNVYEKAFNTIHSNHTIKRNNRKNVEIVDYNGFVWCINCSNNNFVARRNGKAFITSNSIAWDFINDISNGVGLFCESPDEWSDAGLLGSIETEKDGEIIEIPGILDKCDILQIDEASALFQKKNYNQSTILYLQKALNYLHSKTNVIVKRLKAGEVVCKPHCSLWLTSFPPREMIDEVLEKGFFQRVIFYPNIISLDQRKEISNVRSSVFWTRSNDKEINVKSISTDIMNLKTHYKNGEKNTLEPYNHQNAIALVNNKIRGLYKIIEPMENSNQKIMSSFLPNFENNILIFSTLLAISRKSEIVERMDIIQAYDILYDIFTNISSWIETERTDNFKADKELIKIANELKDAEGWILKSEFAKRIENQCKVVKKTAYNRISKIQTISKNGGYIRVNI